MELHDLMLKINAPVEARWRDIAEAVYRSRPARMSLKNYAKAIKMSKGWTVEMYGLGKALQSNPRLREENFTRAGALDYIRRGRRVSKIFGES